jgi:hypothetical protein
MTFSRHFRPGFRPARMLICSLAIATAGCRGTIQDEIAPPPSEGAAGGLNPGAPGADSPGTPGVNGRSADAPPSSAPRDLAAGAPLPAGVRRLTNAQYRRSIRDLLGAEIKLPQELEPDDLSATFASIGAYKTTTSSSGVELFQRAAFDLAAQALGSEATRAAFVSCTPREASDACVRGFLASFGRRVWRRPLTAGELDRYLGLVANVSMLPGADVWKGIEGAVAAMLQSVNFLYLPEIGEPDPSSARRRLTSFEIASRLSYLLWDTTPDEELLAAAEAGKLSTAEGIAAETRRLLASPRAHEGVRTFFRENLALDRLATAKKDPATFPLFSPALAESMGEEMNRLVADAVFVRKADLREIFDTQSTFVDAALARLYGLRMPVGPGFERATFPDDGPRGGLLTLAAPLTINALSVRTSPTMRGVFVREHILCQEVPAPPADVDLVLPAADGSQPRSLRERLAQHREAPACAACHSLFDPIGLSLEHFDAIGIYRTTDGGVPIDASGELDGHTFEGAKALGGLLRRDRRVADCLVKQVYQFALGHEVPGGQDAVLDALSQQFQAGEGNLLDLLAAIATSDRFRFVAASP